MDGFRAIFLRFSLGKRTFRWVFLGKTLFSLHIGRFSCHFLQVFVRKTHVTLGFPRGKPCFPCILDGFRAVVVVVVLVVIIIIVVVVVLLSC